MMSFEANSAFERREEWLAAHLSELEYQEIARTLKALAAEHGAAPQPAIDALALKGLDAALAAIQHQVGESVVAQYYRQRARQRLG